MSNSPYQAPSADLLDKNENSVELYIVSNAKFAVLFFITLGIYSLYWFYQNWRQLKAIDQLTIWPVPRAIFALFFTHSLFKRIQLKIVQQGKAFDWKPELMATSYVLISILSHIVDRLSSQEVGAPYLDIISLLMLPLLYLPLAKAQAAINFCSGDPAGESNSNFTGANIFWIVVGGLFWALIAFGLFAIVTGNA